MTLGRSFQQDRQPFRFPVIPNEQENALVGGEIPTLASSIAPRRARGRVEYFGVYSVRNDRNIPAAKILLELSR